MKQRFRTKAEAIEAWNTWKGRYIEVDPEIFCKSNPCNSCREFINNDGKYKKPTTEKMVGGLQMHQNGSYIVPWPRLTKGQKIMAKKLLNKNDYLAFAFSLCVRWCALFPSVIEYRETILNLLKSNDKNNVILNTQLQKWNAYLKDNGFTPFEKNDLRGVNLGGLRLNGNPFSGIWLRGVDMSFSELSYAQLNGANLYDATLNAVNSCNANFSFSICTNTDFSNSFFSNGHFEGSDIAHAHFINSMCHHSFFDGAIMTNTDLSDTQCTQISLKPLLITSMNTTKEQVTEISNIKFDGASFLNVSTEGIDWSGNQKLKNYIELQKNSKVGLKKGKFWSRITDSIEVKPGLFGFSINLKKIFGHKKRNE